MVVKTRIIKEGNEFMVQEYNYDILDHRMEWGKMWQTVKAFLPLTHEMGVTPRIHAIFGSKEQAKLYRKLYIKEMKKF